MGRSLSDEDHRATRVALLWGIASCVLAAAAGLFVHSWGLLLALPAMGSSIWTLRLWARLSRPREISAHVAALLAGLILMAGVGTTIGVAAIAVMRRVGEPVRELNVSDLARRLDCQNLKEVKPPRGPATEEAECILNGANVTLATFDSESTRNGWLSLGRVRGVQGRVTGRSWAALTNSDRAAAEIAEVLGGKKES